MSVNPQNAMMEAAQMVGAPVMPGLLGHQPDSSMTDSVQQGFPELPNQAPHVHAVTATTLGPSHHDDADDSHDSGNDSETGDDGTETGKRPRSDASGARKGAPKKPRKDSREGRMSWNDNLFELLKFKAEHGHTNVPEEHPIYHWVFTQRKNKRQKDWRQHHGKPENHGGKKLTGSQIKVLNCVDFTWDPYKKSIEEKWKQRFDELVAFKEQHGHTNVPQKSNAKGLSSWVKVQRMNYTHAIKQKQGEKLASEHCVALSQDRIDMLNSIGFEWRVKKVAQGWEARFQQLLEYKAQAGDTLVPFNYVNEHGRLGRWVNKQRHEYSLMLRGEKSQLTEDRIGRLNDIGFRWVAPGFQKKTVKNWVNPHEEYANATDAMNHGMALNPESVHNPAVMEPVPVTVLHHPHIEHRYNDHGKDEHV